LDKRRQTRLNAVGLEVGISDRVGFSTGTIKNISRFGVCITDIPRKLHPKDSAITITISGKEKRFKLQVSPKWEKQDGLTMTTGAMIDNVPLDWMKMIKNMEPQEEDIWAHVPLNL